METVVKLYRQSRDWRRRIDEIEMVLGIRDGLLTEFDGELFGAFVERVEIGEGGKIKFNITRNNKYTLSNSKILRES